MIRQVVGRGEPHDNRGNFPPLLRAAIRNGSTESRKPRQLARAWQGWTYRPRLSFGRSNTRRACSTSKVDRAFCPAQLHVDSLAASDSVGPPVWCAPSGRRPEAAPVFRSGLLCFWQEARLCGDRAKKPGILMSRAANSQSGY